MSLFTRFSAVILPYEAAVGAMGVSLKMLGGFVLRDGAGAELSLPTRKVRALLSYLAVNADKPQPRERLMALLWSDRGDHQARQSLNQALMSIRRLGDDESIVLLDSNSAQVTLRSDAINCDVEQMHSLVSNDPAKAASLYGGPFLDGLSIPDPAFEEWLRATRSELHTLACTALEQAAATAEENGRLQDAIGYARHLALLDPLREGAHRCLMRLLLRSGDRPGALRQYQACVDILNKELQVEPDAATRTLFAAIRRDPSLQDTAKLPTEVLRKAPPVRSDLSIAVLPFENLSDDPVVGNMADGLVDDLIMALVKVRELTVIPHHSTEVYKGKSASIQEIAESLGVRHILEGSLQAGGGRLRCTIHLIDAVQGQYLWTERYDRPMEDVFAVQDEIIWNILVELQVRITEDGSARIASVGTRNLEAWLLRVQAAAELSRVSRGGTRRARELFEAAHKADPNWARPLAGLAFSHYFDVRYGWTTSQKDSIRSGIELAERATKLDPNDPFNYQALRSLHHALGNHEKGVSFAEKAVALAPNDQLAVGMFACTLMYNEDFTSAVAAFDRAARLGPNMFKVLQCRRGLALQLAGDVDRAVGILEDLVQKNPDWPEGLAQLAAAYQDAEQIRAARKTIEKVLEWDPAYTVSRHVKALYFRNEQSSVWLRDLLIKSGLPE